MVLMSLPLSTLAEEKTNSEIVEETPATTLENTNNEIVDQIKEATVSDKTEDTLVEKDAEGEGEEVSDSEEPLVGSENIDDLQTEDLTFYSSSGWSYSWSTDTPDRVTVTAYHGSEETITIPSEYEGNKIVGVSMSELTNTVKTIIVPEGVEFFSLSNAQGLENLSLPSTVKDSIEIINTSLTSLNCFEKVTQLNSLYFRGSKLSDISALKKFDQLTSLSLSDNPGIKDISALENLDQLEVLDLRNNSELSDVSALKKLEKLRVLYLKGTKVSEQDQLDLLREPREIVAYAGPVNTFQIKPEILDLELEVTPLDSIIAEITKGEYQYQGFMIKGMKAGKTEGVIRIKSNAAVQKSFPITIKDPQAKAPAGDKIENIPQIQKSYKASPKTLGETELLELYDNGDLWRVDGEKQEKLLSNIDNYVGAQVYNNSERTWALAQDSEKALWVYENRIDGSTNIQKRLKNVIKYSGLYGLGADNVERACAIDGSQNLWQIDSNGGKVKLMDKVQDFVVLPFRGRSEVAALNTGGELYLYDMVTQNTTKIADQVTAIQSGFIRRDTEVYGNSIFSFVQNGALWGFRSVLIDPNDYGKGTKTETYLISENAMAVMGNFVIKADGSTWYHGTTWDSGHEVPYNCKVLDKPIKDWSGAWYSGFWLLDKDKTLWHIADIKEDVTLEKISENVKKLHFGSGRDIFKGYILENGDYYNSDQEKVNTNVLDVSDVNGFDNCYYLKQDHVVYLNDVALLDHVIRIVKESDYHGNFVRTLMFRDDGSCWASELESDPTPYKLADYQKKITVTGIKLSPFTLTLTQNYTVQLQVTIEPENATNQTVLWTSSHPDIASVENGLVTGVKEGEAVIIATTEDGGKTAECKVSVKKAAPVLNPDSGTAEGITAGETGQAFVEKLKDSGAIEDKNQIKLYKADGQEVSLDTKLATGMKIVVTIGQKMFNRNAGTQEYTVIVLGDISGDGIINIMDMLAAQDDILGKEKLEGCYRTAGDITKDSNINIMDMLAIQDDILGKEKINPYL